MTVSDCRWRGGLEDVVMHSKRDQNRSVNVLGPAALTLAVPLRFIVHVAEPMCVCKIERW